MWLVMHNRILTKNNLYKKGWRGDLTCQFCHKRETITHLFLKCFVARQIWFWFGRSQQHFTDWHSISDIFEFAGTLSKNHQIAFLVIFSAICWTLWKHRNAIIFQDTSIKTIRSIILLIISLFQYWSGSLSKKVKQVADEWLPLDIEAIPLRVWDPSTDQPPLYLQEGSGLHADGIGLLALDGAAGTPAH